MQPIPLILLGIALVGLAFNRTRSQPLRGWQRLLAVIAIVSAVVMLLQPEFLALGLFGDTAFFDLTVLAMSLQMHLFATRALRWSAKVLGRCVPRVWIPSPGLNYLMAVSTMALIASVSTVQKAVHRIWS